MILQALKGYYDRLAGSEGEDVPRLGFARQKIHFCIVVSRDGALASSPVMDLRSHERKRPVPLDLIVPEPVKRTVAIAPNFLWDNSGYVLGFDNKGKPERTTECFAAFKAHQLKIAEGCDDEGLAAVLRFLDRWSPAAAVALPYADELIGQNLVFRLDGDRCYVHDRPTVRDAWIRYYSANAGETRGMCLVTGSEGPIARLHASVKGVANAQPSGAALVSFNLEAFTSYRKDQNFNAPIGEEAAFAYTTALNWLLRNGSRQRIRIGDATVVFWTGRKTLEESLLGMLLNPAVGEMKEEDRGPVENLHIILDAARQGRIQDAVKEPDVPFYILGLSPNNSRLSVRFWHVGTVGEIVANLGRHFSDMAIVKSFSSDPDYPPVWQLLRELAVLGKSENVSPLLAGALTHSVLSGTPYPMNLLPSILVRIRADHAINTLRAGLIKACLVRNHFHTEVGVSLDKNNTNIGYRLGRLFAVLERIQTVANPGISATVRDKYFGAAAATPRNIFPMLLSLSQQHLGKLRRDSEKKKLAGFFDARLEEIIAVLPASPLPAFLDPENQGLFAIGYYHQRQDFFAGKPDKKEEE